MMYATVGFGAMFGMYMLIRWMAKEQEQDRLQAIQNRHQRSEQKRMVR